MHLADVKAYGTYTFRSLHALCDGIWRYEQVVDYAAGLHAQISMAFCKAPGFVDWVVVPLPVERESVGTEFVVAENACLVDVLGGGVVWHFSFSIAKDWPPVFPSAWQETWGATHSVPVLKEDAIPFSCRGVYYTALCYTSGGKWWQGVIEYYLLLPRAIEALCAIAYFTTDIVAGP